MGQIAEDMTDIIKKILLSKTKIWHFFIAFTFSFIFCSFVYAFLIPLFHFFRYGSGASASRVSELPIHIFTENWFALIITLAILFLLLIRNVKMERLGYAKSYVLVIIAITVLYLFKNPIGNTFIELF